MKVLRTSAIPALNSFSGKEESTCGQMKIHSGWLMVPRMFLYERKFTPFLPPMEASTWARRVVGTKANFTPLLYMEAVKPVTSVVMPPPTPSTRAFLSAPCSRSHCAISPTLSRVFFFSPDSKKNCGNCLKCSARCCKLLSIITKTCSFSNGRFCNALISLLVCIFTFIYILFVAMTKI